MTETSQMIGKLVPADADKDAIHIAVLPAVAGEVLRPGQQVLLDHGELVGVPSGVKSLGIVDPFLTGHIFAGDRVWVFLHPNTVTGMRHHWQHPDVPEEVGHSSRPGVLQSKRDRAELWLRNFADRYDFNYDEFVANEGLDMRARRPFNGPDDFEEGDDEDQFWENLEIVTGKEFGTVHRDQAVWRCSC